MSSFAKYAAALAAALLAVVALAFVARSDEDDEPAAPGSTYTTSGATTVPDTSGETTVVDQGGGPETTSVRPAGTLGNTTPAGTSTAETATNPASPPYALAPTRRCLRSAGFVVSKVRSADPRLRALGDLAQKTSLELRFSGQTLGLAFGDTRLLASLLQVPDDPYRMEIDRNALLMYRPAARAEAAVVEGCLRS